MNDYFFEKGKFQESDLEYAIIEQFKQEGYSYVSGETIHREYTDILLTDNLHAYLRSKYASAALTDTELETITLQLSLIPSTPLYAGNRSTFRLINEGYDLNREDVEKMPLHIDFIDYDVPGNNIFKVVNQYSVQGVQMRRPDLLIFINGIPVTICEFKSAIKEDTTVFDAWEQITIRYKQDIPQLLRYCFLSLISDGVNTRLGSIFTPYEFYYAWNKVNDTDSVANGISSLLSMVKGAFAPERLLAILRDFIFYPDASNRDEAIVCRYPQFFAANKMLQNIKAHLRPAGDGKGGIYFGATGCGKTYTMLFLARQLSLRECDTFHNPTVIIITDREDLDSQAAGLFCTATKFLCAEDVRSIESRTDLQRTLRDHPSGGVYITTIQKFCEEVGLLSERNNIICISDEAHRTQTGVALKLKVTETGVEETYGFAKYLRDSFPNATYCGFTGTPVDEALAVFGDEVDSYTMKEACDDGITVRLSYHPRLARVLLSEEQAKEIEAYYTACEEAGSNPEQIEESKRAMSGMTAILGHPDRQRKLAADIVQHYEALCAEKPKMVQKAMIVCADRKTAFSLLQIILELRPEWGVPHRAEDESALTEEQLDRLVPLPKINLVATQGANDEEDLKAACGTKERHKMLDKQFKNTASNFKIAIVVDMWITGFDIPSLAVMYIDKPLQKHTLVQTISRVNRVFEGKDRGLLVDYIGIQKAMIEAVKRYGTAQGNPTDNLDTTLAIFCNQLALINELLCNFDSTDYFKGEPLERLLCLNRAAEYVQELKDRQTRFMDLSRKMKAAYAICAPAGVLTELEMSCAQFYMAVRSIIYKQTLGDAPDAETMNRHVEEMVRAAISCTGVEDIVDNPKSLDFFSEEFEDKLKKVKSPISKFNALLKLLQSAISSYGHVNKVKAIEFAERLRAVVEKYNTRDSLAFVNEVVGDFVDNLSKKLLGILRDLQEDQTSFEKLGITFEEKAFYDILVSVRDKHGFEYPDEKCLELAKAIKGQVDDKVKYADWANSNTIRNKLAMELTILLYRNGYPPEWNEEVFNKVMEQTENFKKYNAE